MAFGVILAFLKERKTKKEKLLFLKTAWLLSFNAKLMVSLSSNSKFVG